MMLGELALMPRSNALAGVNPALGVSVGSRQLTRSLTLANGLAWVSEPGVERDLN
jgi:hypothetical protein